MIFCFEICSEKRREKKLTQFAEFILNILSIQTIQRFKIGHTPQLRILRLAILLQTW